MECLHATVGKETIKWTGHSTTGYKDGTQNDKCVIEQILNKKKINIVLIMEWYTDK